MPRSAPRTTLPRLVMKLRTADVPGTRPERCPSVFQGADVQEYPARVGDVKDGPAEMIVRPAPFIVPPVQFIRLRTVTALPPPRVPLLKVAGRGD